MRTNLMRRSAAAGSILALSLTLAACGGDEAASTSTGTEETPSETMSESMTPSPSESMSDMESGMGEGEMSMSEPFGPACSQVPTSGPGSVEGMAEAPVATAASNNPLLKTLVSAVTEAGLVGTLNSAEALTVFAPAEPAFAKVPKKDLNALLADKPTLTKVLTHHVIGERLSPEQVTGMLETLNKDTLEVSGMGEDLQIGDEKATVLCGNVQTANATVYVIDTVLMP